MNMVSSRFQNVNIFIDYTLQLLASLIYIRMPTACTIGFANNKCISNQPTMKKNDKFPLNSKTAARYQQWNGNSNGTNGAQQN